MEQPNNLNGLRGSASKRRRGSGGGSQHPPRRSRQQAPRNNGESLVIIPRYEIFIKTICLGPNVGQNVNISRLDKWHPVFGIVEGELLDGFVLTVMASNCDGKARGVAYKPGCFPTNRNGVANNNVSDVVPPTNYDLNVGQLVFGVVDGEDDEAFLISLRSIQCDTVLRGKVFKPEHFTPITPESDVALGLPFGKKQILVSMFKMKADDSNDI